MRNLQHLIERNLRKHSMSQGLTPRNLAEALPK
jgi:hypothetical protein